MSLVADFGRRIDPGTGSSKKSSGYRAKVKIGLWALAEKNNFLYILDLLEKFDSLDFYTKFGANMVLQYKWMLIVESCRLPRELFGRNFYFDESWFLFSLFTDFCIRRFLTFDFDWTSKIFLSFTYYAPPICDVLNTEARWCNLWSFSIATFPSKSVPIRGLASLFAVTGGQQVQQSLDICFRWWKFLFPEESGFLLFSLW